MVRSTHPCGIAASPGGSSAWPSACAAAGGWRGCCWVVPCDVTAGYDPVMGAGARGGTAGAAGGGLVVGLLGPVGVSSPAGGLAGVGRPMLRVLVALLAVAGGRVVPDEALVDGLWGEEWSRQREQNLHTHVSALRRLLAAAEPGRDGGRVVRSGGGYRLVVAETEVDAGLFRSLARQGREAARAGDVTTAAGLFTEARGLWRGAALADVVGLCPRLAGDAASMEEQRAGVVEERLECDLALGRHAEVAAEGPGLVAAFPLRERLAGQLMVALYRCGRRGEALAVFDTTRRVLVEQLGLDPGPELARVQAKILADDPALATPSPPAATASDDRAAGRSAGRGKMVVPRQLPAGVGCFAGRDNELKALDELLGQPGDPDGAGAVVVTAVGGMAGVGKSALAVHWARKVADRFSDGQLYVNLRGYDPEGEPLAAEVVTGWFLSALGVSAPAIPADAQARAGLYRSALADRRVLLVLDNARNAAQVRPLLAGGPGCLAIVTSRSSLAGLAASDGARIVPLDLLDPEEATALLVARLGPDRVAAEPGAVDSLISACGRLPLALAITAARAASMPGLSLAGIAAQLTGGGAWTGEDGDAAGALDPLETGDEATSIRDVFSWSSRQLTSGAARMFTLLGLHPGPDISVPAAASLAGTPPRQTRQHLAELTAASLITEQQPGRYTLHDLLRAYAAEQAQDTEPQANRDAAARRAINYYLHQAYQAAVQTSPNVTRYLKTPIAALEGVAATQITSRSGALDWYRAEQQVLPRVLAWVAGLQLDSDVVLLRSCMEGYPPLRYLPAANEASLATALRLGDPTLIGGAYFMRGQEAAIRGAYHEASSHHTSALEHATLASDVHLQALAHNGLAWAADELGHAGDAVEHAQRAVELAQTAGADEGEFLSDLGYYQ